MSDHDRETHAMTTRKRRGTKRRGLAHRPGVWLATVSTVVGIATGMFTLRDEVFPQESGTAGAAGVTSYRQHVGGICDELNEADLARSRENHRLARRLKAARTSLAQRDALLDGVRRTTARSAHALSGLSGLDAPERYVGAQRKVELLWKRNLDRILVYTDRLDQATGRRDLIAAVQVLAHDRSALQRDGLEINAGLERLGEGDCRLRPPIVDRTITLPPLEGQAHTPSPSVTNDEKPLNQNADEPLAPSVSIPDAPAIVAKPSPAGPRFTPGVGLPALPRVVPSAVPSPVPREDGG
jgi:hypothetical protein